jgi:signal transduction histidine kinase
MQTLRKKFFALKRSASLFVFLFSLHAQAQNYPDDIKNLMERISPLIYANKFDSAQALVMQYLEKPGLTGIQEFYGHYLLGDFIKNSNKPEEAIQLLQESKKYIPNIPNKIRYESLVNGNIAECYFNHMDYENAKKFASLSVKSNPDSSLRSGGHAVNYLIIGYKDYLEKNYSYAIECYHLAIKEYSRSGESCELPLVYTKMAKVYNGMGSLKEAERNINRAIVLSDSCNIAGYKLLSVRTMFDIYKENKDYEKALANLEEINVLVEKAESKKHAQMVGEMEVKYQTRLMLNENYSLKQFNQKNEEILSKQKLALTVTIIAIVILSVLSLLLVRLSVQRKRAEHNLAVLNLELEKKITERTEHLKKANAKIEENSALLSFQNKQLIDFCNIISHNLRSPLVNMSMLVTFIEKSHDADEQRVYVEKLKPVIDTLNETFAELVESLQIRQDMEIKSEKVNLTDCLSRILTGLDAEINRSGAVISSHFGDVSHIFYPPKYLSSIFHNLVSNALKYKMPGKKPEVSIETRRVNGSIVLSVKDNGLGIDLKKHKENLFKIRKVFHQHPDAKGFGLYITKTQIETMGGRIWVDSMPDQGSTFFVEFKNQNI